ncbi:hypothetical protein TNCV_4965441 [Trichonephila clavipes]|nr:hypothetical protein TNCV_4965441 [Trichonephila clavipes]
MSDIGPFPGYFLDDKQYHSRARSVGVYNPMTDCTYSHLRTVRMPCPVQSNCGCSRHHCKRAVRYCLVNGTHRTGLRAYSPPPLKCLATVFR